ncbi:MAG: phage tail sheath subtilisin-like domain-containing protein [Candidatus Poseidoniales archaeon]
MAVDFPISPGVVTTENDNSIRQTVVPLGSVGSVIGRYSWGPAMVPTMVSEEAEYVEQFGTPTDSNYIEWFNGKNFLEYGNSLNVVRLLNEDSARNACFSGIDSILIKNDEDYINNLIIEEGGISDGTGGSITIGQTPAPGPWIARYPGEKGNTLRVDTCYATDTGRTIVRDDPAGVVLGSLANTNPDIRLNQIRFEQVDGHKYDVFFEYNDSVANTPLNLWGGTQGYFEDSTDVLADGSLMNQEKVVSFEAGSGLNRKEYNLLITNIDSANKKVSAYVNVFSSGHPDPVVQSLLDPIETLTVKQRSKFREFSYDAKRNSPNNLFGKLYFKNNERTVYGVGTAFAKQLSKGDIVTVAGQAVSVLNIDSDLKLTVARPLVGDYEANTAQPWTREWQYANYFASEPATSNHIRLTNGDLSAHHNDQLHIVVIDEGGEITGKNGEVIETYAHLSLAKDGKDDYGVPTYYVNRINNGSDWIRWSNHALVADADNNWGEKTLGSVFQTYNKVLNALGNNLSAATFGGGSNGDQIENDDIITAIELFKAKETYETDFMLTGWTYDLLSPLNYHLLISKMIQVAEERKDCVVAVSGEYGAICRGKANADDITDNFVTWRSAIIDSSYAIMDGNFKYQYDSYNNTYRWLPLSGDIAGLMARTDELQAPWYSPAGMSRGQIANVVKLAYSPSQGNRDTLYEAQINPVVTFMGEGTVLYGDKTLQVIPSAFDRINVRRLFIRLKDYIVVEARKKLFEFNTPSTRAEFKRLADRYLEQVRNDQGLSEFRVICDESNNTNQLIEENKFVADIYVKPTYVINFIKLNFTAVGQTVEFADLGL